MTKVGIYKQDIYTPPQWKYRYRKTYSVFFFFYHLNVLQQQNILNITDKDSYKMFVCVNLKDSGASSAVTQYFCHPGRDVTSIIQADYRFIVTNAPVEAN